MARGAEAVGGARAWCLDLREAGKPAWQLGHVAKGAGQRRQEGQSEREAHRQQSSTLPLRLRSLTLPHMDGGQPQTDHSP